MARNIVVCCDGTGNEIAGDFSNVLKLFRLMFKDERQIVFYSPGVGTLGTGDDWARLKNEAFAVIGLATGYGLDDDVLDAYRFLVQRYQPGDRIFLFGFSRGAYAVRVLAGFIHMLGLLRSDQVNLAGYALVAYKRAAERDQFRIAWEFKRVTRTLDVKIHFLGCWDTVASVIVPRRDRFYLPTLRSLPYTARNPSVRVFRQAMAIDERRRMFRLNRWQQQQDFVLNKFDSTRGSAPQDVRQVWFAGVHSDVGGGYPEAESALAKFPLLWMVEQAKANGLRVQNRLVNHLVNGIPLKGSKIGYTPPSAAGKIHDSLTWGWTPLEVLPKSAVYREWPARDRKFAFYLPLGEPRVIGADELIHSSVLERMQLRKDYRPPNLPVTPVIEDP